MKANETQHGGAHYAPGSQYQYWDWATDMGLRFLEGCVGKYVYRWRKKGGLGDLKKAEHFAKKLLEVYGENRIDPPSFTSLIARGDEVERFVKENEIEPTEAAICYRLATWESAKDLREIIEKIQELMDYEIELSYSLTI